tara:strand:+ start:468 stop:1736 length:1269 start_codon:yes stop_codon:yes gene_type:complete
MTISIKGLKDKKNEAAQNAQNAVVDSLSNLTTSPTKIETHVKSLNISQGDKDYLTQDYYKRLKALNIQKDLIDNHIAIAEDIKSTFERDLNTMVSNLQLYKKYKAQGLDTANDKYEIAEDEYTIWDGVMYDKNRHYSLYTGGGGGSNETFATPAWKFPDQLKGLIDVNEGHLAHVEGGADDVYTYGVIYKSFLNNLNLDTTQNNVQKYHLPYAYSYNSVIADYEPAMYNTNNELIKDPTPIIATFNDANFYVTPAANVNLKTLRDKPSLFLNGAEEDPLVGMDGMGKQKRVGQIVLGNDGSYHIITPTMFNLDIGSYTDSGMAQKSYNITSYGAASVDMKSLTEGDIYDINRMNLLDQTVEYSAAVSAFINGYKNNVASFMNEFEISTDSELGKQLLSNIPSFNAAEYDWRETLDNSWDANE